MKVVYEDNHLIIVHKSSGEIVQGDKTGDTPLSDMVAAYIKQKYDKPGKAFALSLMHVLASDAITVCASGGSGRFASTVAILDRNSGAG